MSQPAQKICTSVRDGNPWAITSTGPRVWVNLLRSVLRDTRVGALSPGAWRTTQTVSLIGNEVLAPTYQQPLSKLTLARNPASKARLARTTWPGSTDDNFSAKERRAAGMSGHVVLEARGTRAGGSKEASTTSQCSASRPSFSSIAPRRADKESTESCKCCTASKRAWSGSLLVLMQIAPETDSRRSGSGSRSRTWRNGRRMQVSMKVKEGHSRKSKASEKPTQKSNQEPRQARTATVKGTR